MTMRIKRRVLHWTLYEHFRFLCLLLASVLLGSYTHNHFYYLLGYMHVSKNGFLSIYTAFFDGLRRKGLLRC